MGSENPANNQPRMIITFRVKSFYIGDGVSGPEIQVLTGMGLGDCGAKFQTGLDYLMYAYRSNRNPAALWVNSCDPGGWIGGYFIATQLRYLRKQAPLKSDLAPLPGWTTAGEPSEWQEATKRYAAATGQICGVIVKPGEGAAIEGGGGWVRFLSASGYSPDSYSSAVELDREGRFCSGRLGPGDYYLQFTRGSKERGTITAVYLPGVADRDKATIVKVAAGQVSSNLKFAIPRPKAYTIHGFLSIDDKPGSGVSHVHLLGFDGQTWDSQAIDLQGSFPLPKVKYFAFKNVVPGRYIAFASPLSSNGYTRIAHVQVISHGKLMFLALKNQNASKSN
jgi:hypothetical protein